VSQSIGLEKSRAIRTLSVRRDVSDLSSFRGAQKCEKPAIFSRFRVESLTSECVELESGGTRCDRELIHIGARLPLAAPAVIHGR
jgi:hypothetical protein